MHLGMPTNLAVHIKNDKWTNYQISKVIMLSIYNFDFSGMFWGVALLNVFHISRLPDQFKH